LNLQRASIIVLPAIRSPEQVMIPKSEARQTYDEILVFSGLDPAEVDQLRDWYCYTKPVGPSIRVMVHSASPGHGFGFVAAGSEPGHAESDLCSEPSGENDKHLANAILK
jgi:hypothetical protein